MLLVKYPVSPEDAVLFGEVNRFATVGALVPEDDVHTTSKPVPETEDEVLPPNEFGPDPDDDV